MSGSGWYDTVQYKSESTEQLDKLLAGLDQLSETLPDLAGDREMVNIKTQHQVAVRKLPAVQQQNQQQLGITLG